MLGVVDALGFCPGGSCRCLILARVRSEWSRLSAPVAFAHFSCCPVPFDCGRAMRCLLPSVHAFGGAVWSSLCSL